MKGTQSPHGTEKAWSAQTTPRGRVYPHDGSTSHNGSFPARNEPCATQFSQRCQGHPSPLARNALYLVVAVAITKAKERYLWALVIQEEKKQRCSRELEALKEVTSRAVSLISLRALGNQQAIRRNIWLLSSQNDLGGAL